MSTFYRWCDTLVALTSVCGWLSKPIFLTKPCSFACQYEGKHHDCGSIRRKERGVKWSRKEGHIRITCRFSWGVSDCRERVSLVLFRSLRFTRSTSDVPRVFVCGERRLLRFQREDRRRGLTSSHKKKRKKKRGKKIISNRRSSCL